MSIFEYFGSDVRVIDGDTLELTLTTTSTVELDVGFHVRVHHELRSSTRQKVRLRGLNCPEVVGATRAAGLAAKTEVIGKVAAATVVRVVTSKVKSGDDKLDLYGRYLAEVYLDGESLNQHLLSHGFAVPFMVEG